MIGAGPRCRITDHISPYHKGVLIRRGNSSYDHSLLIFVLGTKSLVFISSSDSQFHETIPHAFSLGSPFDVYILASSKINAGKLFIIRLNDRQLSISRLVFK